MRVLVTVIPGLGHLHPMVPLCRALEAAGHEVRVAVPPRFVPVVERAGLTAATVRPDWLEEDADAFRPGFTTGGAETQLTAFAEISRLGAVEDLVRLGRTWRPHVVLHDHTAFAGWIAAELLEIPNVPYAMTARVLDPLLLRVLVPHAVDELLEHFGLPADPELLRPTRWLYLDSIPPSFAGALFPPGPTVRSVRYATDDRTGDESLPEWIRRERTRPLVYVTLGSVFNRTPGLMATLIRGAAALDVDVLVTTGRNADPAALGPLPERVRVERYVPQVQLLQHCDAVVCHGGFNTVFGALGVGVPAVLVPLSADQTFNAYLCDTNGFGRSCTTETPEVGFPVARPAALQPVQVTEALQDVLTEPAYRTSAARVAAEIRDQPPVEEGVRLLSDLVASSGGAGR